MNERAGARRLAEVSGGNNDFRFQPEICLKGEDVRVSRRIRFKLKRSWLKSTSTRVSWYSRTWVEPEFEKIRFLFDQLLISFESCPLSRARLRFLSLKVAPREIRINHPRVCSKLTKLETRLSGEPCNLEPESKKKNSINTQIQRASCHLYGHSRFPFRG